MHEPYIKLVFRSILLLTLILFNGYFDVAVASIVEAKGTSILRDSDVSKARQVALQDAMRQAMLQAGANVTTTSNVEFNVLATDSVRIRAKGTVTDVVVLDEWIDKDDEHYHILIRARVESSKDDDEDANRYRKKVAFTQFNVLDRHQIHDMPQVEKRVSQELMRRLESSADMLTVDATQYLLPLSSQPAAAIGISQRQAIIDLAKTLGVQVILTGTILDMGTTDHALGIQLRHVELEVALYDGITGSLIAKFRDNGSTWTGRWFDFPVIGPAMNDKYFAAPIGQVTHVILNHFVFAISKTLLRLPFTARVVRTSGRQIYFDVGALANVQVGDVFMAYRLSEDPITAPFMESPLGYQETPAASLVVKFVQPLFAMAELDAKASKLRVGDVVRFIW